MKLLQRGVALALLTTFTLASETALAYEQDKTYKITVAVRQICNAKYNPQPFLLHIMKELLV